jgi:adenylate kinase
VVLPAKYEVGILRERSARMDTKGTTRATLPLIFLGAPGTGKGTQSIKISKMLGIPHISTGNIFRENVRNGTPLGCLAKTFMDRGELVSDEIVNGMVKERLHQPDCAGGFLLDGYPRTVAQAQVLKQILAERGQQEPVVVNLMVSYEAIVDRLSSRRTCPTCHSVYNVKTKKPSNDLQCDIDQTLLVQRSDDREDAIRERLVAYELLTAPLIEFYRKGGRLLQLDGEQPPDKITEDLGKLLADF